MGRLIRPSLQASRSARRFAETVVAQGVTTVRSQCEMLSLVPKMLPNTAANASAGGRCPLGSLCGGVDAVGSVETFDAGAG